MALPMLSALLRLPPAVLISITVYISMLGTFVVFGYSVSFYFFALAAFLVLATFLIRTGSEPFPQLNHKQKLLLIFALALTVRFIMLVQDQIITRDILSYVSRSEKMLSGQIPYVDFFGGNKPPLYNYMLFAMGLLLTPGPIQFRAFFSVIDAAVASSLFIASAKVFDAKWGFRSGLIYALCPLNIIVIGLEGHYEPVIMLFLIFALIFFFKNKFAYSSLCLGTAFALKIFPIVILPFLLVKIKTYRERITYLLLFCVPMALSLLPLLILSPDAIILYLHEEANWGGSLSFNFVLIELTGLDRVFGISTSIVILGIFLLLILLMFITWIRSDARYAHCLFWFKIVILVMILNYSLMFVMAFTFYEVQITTLNILLFVLVPLILFYALTIFLINKYFPRILPGKIHESDHFILILAFAVILFLFGLPSFAPWYMLWYFPLILLVRTDKIRLTILWLMFWHHTGVGVSLLPGLFPVN